MRPEHAALLILLNPPRAAREERRLVRLLRGAFAWNEFIILAERKLVAPMVLFQLRRHELLDLAPPHAQKKLHDIYERVAMRNAILIRDLQQVNRELGSAEIDWLPLKGTALMLRSIYPDRGLRVLSRLELLVRPEQAAAAHVLLMKSAYRTFLQGGTSTAPWPPLINNRHTVIELHAAASHSEPVPERNLDGGKAQVGFDEARMRSLEILRYHLEQDVAQHPAWALRTQVDLWYLNQALRESGIRPSFVFHRPRELARSLRLDEFRGEARSLRPGVWLRKLFPDRSEMIKRHGSLARGWGVVPLYAARFLRMQRQPWQERMQADR